MSKSPKSPPRQLTEKQQRFVSDYLSNGRNAAAAYRSAYNTKASPANAGREAAKLLKHPLIAPRIAAVVQTAVERTQITADRVIAEVAGVAFSDVGDILDFSGADVKLRPANQIPAEARRAISSIKVKRHLEGSGDDATEVEVTEFKLWPKMDALEKLGRVVGAFPKESASPVNVNVLVGVAAARSSAADPDNAQLADQMLDYLAPADAGSGSPAPAANRGNVPARAGNGR